MQISYQWLQTWVKPSWSVEMLIERLTAAGIELEGMQVLPDDIYLEFKITPNRGDCLSILGLAREVALLSETAFVDPTFGFKIPDPHPHNPLQSTGEGTITPLEKGVNILIESPGCLVYRGRTIMGINLKAVTPAWMEARLQASQISLIHPIVDILNYVMLELGQPMHAFDLDKITGSIKVRASKPGESLVLLDNREVALKAETLCIADDVGPLALAGTMGGFLSSVTNITTNVFLESAWFEPSFIARQARFYGIQSDSAYRYERGVDLALAERALDRATQLVIELCSGEGGPISQAGVIQKQRPMILLRASRLLTLLGVAVDVETVENILTRVGCAVKAVTGGWEINPPMHRLDITLEVDLIEEVGRVYGYDRLPVLPLKVVLNSHKVSESAVQEGRLLAALVDRGYNEVITYSFVSSSLQAWADPNTSPKQLLNPITQEMGCMRTQVWPSLVETWSYNRDRQQDHLKIFEFGHRYAQDGSQVSVIAGLWAGRCSSVNWSDVSRAVDFFDLKGDLEGLFDLWGETVTFVATEHPSLHPGQTAHIIVAGKPVGILGALHPKVQTDLGLTEPVIVFELLYEELRARQTLVTSLSKFPSIRRDLALLLPEGCAVSLLLETIRETVGSWLEDCLVFDVYQGKGISEGKKSIALGLILQHPERTFRDEEVEQCIERVKQVLEVRHSALLRE